MGKKDLGELKKYFREIYPYMWEHYKFLFERRTNNRKFEFLLTFESLLTLIFVTLFTDLILAGELTFIIPLLSFLISIFFSLYNVIPITIYFPWFEKKHIEDVWRSRKEKDFSEQGLRSIYGVLGHITKYAEKRGKLFFYNFQILYISIILTFLGILIYNTLYLPTLLFVPISILLWSLIQKNWNKEVVKKSPAPEVEKSFDDWKERILKNT